MTMLTPGLPFKPAPQPAGSRDASRPNAAAVYLAIAKRFSMHALKILAAAAAVAAVMALKVAVYLPGLFHH
jgi:hypothetical protein